MLKHNLLIISKRKIIYVLILYKLKIFNLHVKILVLILLKLVLPFSTLIIHCKV